MTLCPLAIDPLRRRPFLVRGIENTLIKLLLSTEFFDELNRKKIGIGEKTRVRCYQGVALRKLRGPLCFLALNIPQLFIPTNFPCAPPAALALIFSLKISVNPESILTSCFNDRLITKGTMLEVLTVFLQVLNPNIT